MKLLRPMMPYAKADAVRIVVLWALCLGAFLVMPGGVGIDKACFFLSGGAFALSDGSISIRGILTSGVPLLLLVFLYSDNLVRELSHSSLIFVRTAQRRRWILGWMLRMVAVIAGYELGRCLLVLGVSLINNSLGLPFAALVQFAIQSILLDGAAAWTLVIGVNLLAVNVRPAATFMVVMGAYFGMLLLCLPLALASPAMVEALPAAQGVLAWHGDSIVCQYGIATGILSFSMWQSGVYLAVVAAGLVAVAAVVVRHYEAIG